MDPNPHDLKTLKRATNKTRRRPLDAAILLAFGVMLFLGFMAIGFLGRQQSEIAEITSNTNLITHNLVRLLDQIESATDPTGCIARRAAYATTVAVLQIINDNRSIHHAKPVVIPKPPADIAYCESAQRALDVPHVTSDIIRGPTRTVVITVPGPTRTVTRTIVVCQRPKVRAC